MFEEQSPQVKDQSCADPDENGTDNVKYGVAHALPFGS